MASITPNSQKNIDFAILREGCRTRKDYLFDTHINGCRAARIPIRGVYHFIYAVTNAQAKAEAESCLLIQAVGAVFGVTWDFGDLSQKLIAVVNAVFVVLAILGIVTDHTTEGIGDSNRAMTYDEPYKDIVD